MKQEGPWGFVARVAVSPFYRSMVFTVRPLETGDAGGQLPPVAGGFGTQSDIDMIAKLNPRSTPTALRARLERGERCYLASVDGKAVSCRWVGAGEARLGERDPVLCLHCDEAYVYQIYVRPEYRGKGINSLVRSVFDRDLIRLGFKTQVGFVMPGRAPWGRDNPHLVATIHTLHLGPFHKFWVRAYGPQADYWRERLKELRWG